MTDRRVGPPRGEPTTVFNHSGVPFGVARMAEREDVNEMMRAQRGPLDSCISAVCHLVYAVARTHTRRSNELHEEYGKGTQPNGPE